MVNASFSLLYYYYYTEGKKVNVVHREYNNIKKKDLMN